MKGGLNSEAFTTLGKRPGGFLKGLSSSAGVGGKSSSSQRSQSAVSLDIAEVRALGNDEPFSAEQDPNNTNKSEHGTLMIRLKSREARAKAESNREFLTKYRLKGASNPKDDDWLDRLLKGTTARADELRVKSEELQIEMNDAERKLERATSQTVSRANDTELQAMTAFERSQRRVQEDKREEELQKLRDEAQANYVRVHRRLQNELIELRDYKVLLVEFRRLRLEKLQETLGRVSDGRRSRACVREMIRHGANRILDRLERAKVPLESWMREVLVNSCHLELRIEDSEDTLLKLQRRALGPVKAEVQDMVNASKQDRFETLCVRTWESRRRCAVADEPVISRETTIKFAPSVPQEADDTLKSTYAGSNAGVRGIMAMANAQKSSMQCLTRVPEDIAGEMQTVEADIAAFKKLLNDMRANAAAVICHHIRETEKTGARAATNAAMEDGFRMLKLLVNEDFAKTTIKELQKSAPQGKFVFNDFYSSVMK
jgi:hypothetical protein